MAAGEAPKASRESKVQLARMFAIATVVSVLGVIAGLLIDWFPVSASGEAEKIDTLWDVLLIASVPIFVFVQTYVIYTVMKFRMRPGEELMDGPPIHGNTRLEVIWTAIPAILMVGLCTYAYVVLTDIEDATAGEQLDVRVVGEQFTWTFNYKGSGGEDITSNELYLPVDTQVEFTVQSKDVIHDFWVPAFREKIDAVPGIDTRYGVNTTREGSYPVVCAELCGLGHAAMRQTARVVPRAQFDQWLSEQEARQAER